MSGALDAMRRLARDARATFALSDAGRILAENDPDRSAGPRLYLAGCAGGNLVLPRHDVDEEAALRIRRLVEREPPWVDPERPPACLPELIDLVSRDGAVEIGGAAVVHRLLPGRAVDVPAEIVHGASPKGQRLLARLAAEGMPPALVEAGFVDVGDFWPPWCVALEREEIAAIAFAARTGVRESSIGVYTFPVFRGRGLAAAVTARWAALPSLRGRALFYSALWANASSLRVIERLGLPRLGVSLRLG